LDTKGFWRAEKDKPAELRYTVLAQVAFRSLTELGVAGFLGQHDGEGWMLPETLRLTDFGLGHDDRAGEHHPVDDALGPRFYPWQLEQSVEESWEECELHAQILAKLLPSSKSEQVADEIGDDTLVDLFGNVVNTDLFGNPTYPVKGRMK
jgi:hypothetical protein